MNSSEHLFRGIFVGLVLLGGWHLSTRLQRLTHEVAFVKAQQAGVLVAILPDVSRMRVVSQHVAEMEHRLTVPPERQKWVVEGKWLRRKR